MLDFSPLRRKEITLAQLCESLSPADLRNLTEEMIDRQLEMIAGCTDADVIFEPLDPLAKDNAAATPDEVDMPWTLGHVIVHTTASAEEAAFLAAEMARGVHYEPRRSRAEVHWTTVRTIAACRARLEESRRMRLASLDMWPAPPHLDNTYVSPQTGAVVTPIMRFVTGLSHDDSHLGQIADIVGQAAKQ